MRFVAIGLTLLAMMAGGHARAAGCTAPSPALPDIAGSYIDNFGSVHMISGRFWTSAGSVFETCSVDNGASQLIAFNNPANGYNPGKFSRFDWVKAEGRLWYCQAVFDASTEGAAAQGPAADPSRPSERGCGTFPWTTLIKILP